MSILVDQIAESIARMEGFFKPGSVAARNNNPGNLRAWGNRPVVNGFAQFETAAEGWAALRRQVELNIARGLTLQEFFGGKTGVYSGYAPAQDNNRPAEYARFVAQQAGVSDNVPLNNLTAPSSPPSAESNTAIYAAVTVAAVSLLYIVAD